MCKSYFTPTFKAKNEIYILRTKKSKTLPDPEIKIKFHGFSLPYKVCTSRTLVVTFMIIYIVHVMLYTHD